MLCNDCRRDLITQGAHRRGRRTNEDDLLGRGSQSFGESGVLGCVTPTSPDGMDVHSLGHIDDQLDVRIVVVICASGYLKNEKISHLATFISQTCDCLPRRIDRPYECNQRLPANPPVWP